MSDTEVAAEADVTTSGGNPPEYKPLVYRGGHYDTSIEGFPMVLDMPMIRTGWLPIGDDPEGPALAIVIIPPGMEAMVGPPHFHNSAQVRVMLEGSMKIGNKWYRKGDIRLQQNGMVYGPETHGPEGSSELLFFPNRRGMFPHYSEMDAGAFGALMKSTGIEPN